MSPILPSLFSLLASNGAALADASTVDPDEVLRVDISLHESDDDDDHDHYLVAADLKSIGRLCDDSGWREREFCARVAVEDLGDEFIWENAYFMMGVAPAATFVPGTFHPHLRYDAELGMTWYHPKKPRTLTVGVDGHLFNLFDRAAPGGGADIVGSASFGPAYVRAGLGVLGGLPRGLDSNDTRPAIGGLVGVGVQVNDGFWGGRLGVDYDVRVDREMGVMHTALLSARFTWGF